MIHREAWYREADERELVDLERRLLAGDADAVEEYVRLKRRLGQDAYLDRLFMRRFPEAEKNLRVLHNLKGQFSQQGEREGWSLLAAFFGDLEALKDASIELSGGFDDDWSRNAEEWAQALPSIWARAEQHWSEVKRRYLGRSARRVEAAGLDQQMR